MRKIAFILLLLIVYSVASLCGLAAEGDLAPEINCIGYNEYLEYVQSGDKYPGFVPYEEIESLGAFKQYTYSKYNESHYYFLEDGVNFESSPENFYTYDVWLDSSESSDLRFCSQKQGAAGRVVGKCVYVYDFGELEYIKWESVDRGFLIYFNDISALTGKNEFVVSLLDEETAIATQEQLFASMNIVPLVPDGKIPLVDANTESNVVGDPASVFSDALDLIDSATISWLWVCIGGGAAVVIGGAVAVALIVRKKRRRAVAASDSEGALTPDGM